MKQIEVPKVNYKANINVVDIVTSLEDGNTQLYKVERDEKGKLTVLEKVYQKDILDRKLDEKKEELKSLTDDCNFRSYNFMIYGLKELRQKIRDLSEEIEKLQKAETFVTYGYDEDYNKEKCELTEEELKELNLTEKDLDCDMLTEEDLAKEDLAQISRDLTKKLIN